MFDEICYWQKDVQFAIQARVTTNSGKEFLIDWKHKDLNSFKKCHEAWIEQAYGDLFEFKPFNEV